MTKLGMIVRADKTGLGNQTRNLCYMLKPDVVMIVNSKFFNGNEQHNEWYDQFNCQVTKSWPTMAECAKFMNGLTHLVTAETIYNTVIFELARKNRTKIFIQPNWEFLDHLNQPLPQPEKWLMPSYWHLEEMIEKFPNTVYLPPPIFLNDFKDAKETNLKRSGKKNFVHIVGKMASNDRNGTLDVLEAVKLAKEEFTLTIKSQSPITEFGDLINDRRIVLDFTNPNKESEMYSGFDAMILPRRYAGLCLPMNEALSSGLPVIMSDVSPNNRILPSRWLIQASKKETLMTRALIDVYKTNIERLARKIDDFAKMSDNVLKFEKIEAFDIAYNEFSSDKLFPIYQREMYE